MRAMAQEVVVQKPRQDPGVAQLVVRDFQDPEKVEIVGCAFLCLPPPLYGLRMARQERLKPPVVNLGLGGLSV